MDNGIRLIQVSFVRGRNVLVENETTEHGETTVQRNGLRDREATHA